LRGADAIAFSSSEVRGATKQSQFFYFGAEKMDAFRRKRSSPNDVFTNSVTHPSFLVITPAGRLQQDEEGRTATDQFPSM